jgi:REP element-mobilizing transposase RayT
LPSKRDIEKMKHLNIEGYAYFVTTNVQNKQKVFLDTKLADIVISALFFLRDKGYYRLCSFVVMPDHLHIIILPQKNKSISQIMHSLKSYTAKKINDLLGLSGKVWQDGFYERVIRSEDDLREKAGYIENNPVRKKLVEEPESYLYSSAHCREMMDYF